MSKQKILIPLDGTDVSRQILPTVCDLFPPEHFEIWLLRADRVPREQLNLGNVASRPAVMTGDFVPYGALSTHAADSDPHALFRDTGWNPLKEKLREELAVDISGLRDKGYDISVAIHFGKPDEEIVALASQEKVALVAMASHGRAGVKRLLQGSVAEDVLHQLSIPLLVLNVSEQ